MKKLLMHHPILFVRMESPHVRHMTSYYEEDGVSVAQIVKGFVDHLLAKSTNRWRKIKVESSPGKVDQQMAKNNGRIISWQSGPTDGDK